MSWTEWTPLQERLDDLPLVIAGPIVRQVTLTEVSVWIAMKSRKGLQLKVYSSISGIVLNSSNIVLQSAIVNPIKLGEHLYVACITGTITGNPLSSNHQYYYDIEFSAISPDTANTKSIFQYNVISQNHGLLDSGPLTDFTPYKVNVVDIITYGDDILPSFLTPVENIDQLAVLSGSTRTPHRTVDGVANDAFKAADEHLNDQFSWSVYRPQHLFLTGNQIIADYNYPLMNFLVADAAKTLFGWDESVPLGGGNQLLPNDDRMKPGKRHTLFLDHSGFDEIDYVYWSSHLVSFSEYCIMYLMSWSNVLWYDSGNTQYPAPNYPPWSPNFQYMNGIVYYEQMPSIWEFQKDLKYIRRVLANVSTYMMFDEREITKNAFSTYDWNDNVLGGAGKPFGKRVISNGLLAANIFQCWGNDPSNPAYDPNSSNQTLFKTLKEMVANPADVSKWNLLESTLIPSFQMTHFDPEESIYELSSYKTTPTVFSSYNFCVTFSNYRIMGLDTRTNRSYLATLKDSPTFVNAESLSFVESFKYEYDVSNIDKLTLLISPKAVFENKHILYEQYKEIGKNIRKTNLWGVLVNLTKNVLRLKIKKLWISAAELYVEEVLLPDHKKQLNIDFDNESFEVYRKPYEELIRHLSYYMNVIIFSTQKGHSYSSKIKYMATEGETVLSMGSMIQNVTSPFRNFNHLGYYYLAPYLNSADYFDASDTEEKTQYELPFKYAGFNTGGTDKVELKDEWFDFLKEVNLEGDPAVILLEQNALYNPNAKLPDGVKRVDPNVLIAAPAGDMSFPEELDFPERYALLVKPDWSYIIEHLSDKRSPEARTETTFITNPANRELLIEASKKTIIEYSNNKNAIADNNICLTVFESWATFKTVQMLFFQRYFTFNDVSGSGDIFLAYTLHKAKMSDINVQDFPVPE